MMIDQSPADLNQFSTPNSTKEVPQSAPTNVAASKQTSSLRSKMGNLLSYSARTKSVVSSGVSKKTKSDLNRAINRNSVTIQNSFDPALRKSLLDDINDLENNVRNDNNPTLPAVVETEEEVDIENFR